MRYDLGFVLGLLGLSLFTLGYAVSEYGWQIRFLSELTFGIIAIWCAYILFSPTIQRLNPKLSLILGLTLLAFLPLYMWSYDSTYYTRRDLVSVSRTISQDNTVALTFGYDVYSTLDPFPVIVSDSTFNLQELNWGRDLSNPTGFLAAGSCKGGTLYPFGHLGCNPTFIIQPPSANNFTGNIIGFSFLGGLPSTIATSLMYSQPVTHGSPGFPVCWNMITNAPATLSVSGPNFVCS